MSDTFTRNAALAKQMADIVQKHVRDAVAPLVQRNIELEARIKELEARPIAKDGAPGRDGIDGKDGAPGRDGRDGVYVKSHVVNNEGVLVLTMSDGSNVVTGIRSGRDGKDGPAGKDGADGINGKDGRDGIDGKSVDVDIREIVAGVIAELPKPRDGRDGVDGKDGAPGKDGEKGVDGKDGRDGIDGKDGAPGRDGKDADPALIERMVAEKVAAIPVLKGDSGERGADGKDGRDGIDGKDGRDGKDADPNEIAKLLIPEVERAVAQLPRVVGADIDKDGNLIIRKSDGSTDSLGRIVGSDGAGFDNIETVEDDLTFGVRFGRGAATKELRWAKSTLADVDQGVWKDGGYKRGQCATFGGSYWLAKRDTQSKPGTDDSWRLIVKRGQDGKDRK